MSKGTKTEIFPKMVYKWPAVTLKDSQHHWSSEKWESNHNEMSSHTCSNGNYQKIQKKINVDEDREKEIFYTVDKKVN